MTDPVAEAIAKHLPHGFRARSYRPSAANVVVRCDDCGEPLDPVLTAIGRHLLCGGGVLTVPQPAPAHLPRVGECGGLGEAS
jgi:hypothetical protein